MPETDDREKILKKLAKLRAAMESAKNVGSSDEAENYAEQLNRLLLQYKISEHELDHVDTKAGSDYGTNIIYPGGKKSKRIAWTEFLAIRLQIACFCRVLISRNSNAISAFGRARDRELMGYMLEFLTNAIDLTANRRFRRLEAGYRQGYKASFRNAATLSVSDRLARLRVEMTNSPNSGRAELALRTEDQRLAEAYSKAFPATHLASKLHLDQGKHELGRTEGHEFGLHVDVYAGIREEPVKQPQQIGSR